MTNPSRITFLHRITRGNVANPYGDVVGGPDADEFVVSAHEVAILIREWDSGVLTKSEIVASYNFTHASDSGDLDAMIGWYQGATDKDAWLTHLEGRLVLARDKGSSDGLDGRFSYAVKATLINGKTGTHSLEDTGPVNDQFNNWV